MVAQALTSDLLKVGWHVILIARGQQALEKVQSLVFMKMFRVTEFTNGIVCGCVCGCVCVQECKCLLLSVFVNILFFVRSICKTKGMIAHDSAGKTPYG